MSDLIATYDPNVPPVNMTGGSFKTQYLSNGIGTLVMWNNSDWEQDIQFPNGDTDVLPAWTAVRFDLQGPYGDVQWSQDTQLASVSATPISQVKVVAYRSNESVPGVYPVALVRQTNIANAVSTNVTATNAIDNETNGPGVNWLKVVPTDAASSTFLGDTSGNLTVKSDNAGTLLTLLQLIAGASPAVKLAAAALLTEVLGNLQVDGTLIANGGINVTTIRDDTTGATQATLATAGITIQKILTLLAGLAVTGTSSLDNGGITTDGSGNLNLVTGLLEIAGVTVLSKGANTHLNSPALAQILFDVGGVNVASIDTTGVNAINGVNYNVGRIKDINNGTVAASGTVNHGLSGTPAAVLMTPDVAGSTWTVSANTYTSTQFSCTLNSALTTRWVAYR